MSGPGGVPCLIVPGRTRVRGGYGRCHIRRFGVVILRRHRLAWIDAHGQLPPADRPLILHRCDVGECEEPTHLYAGTHEDNMRDMVERKRARGPRPGRSGAGNGRARLTADLVRVIRAEHARGVSQQVLADRYKVGQVTISDAVLGKTWANLG